MRDELMGRLWAEATVGPSGLAKEISRQMDLHKDKLALYRAIEARDFPNGPGDKEASLRHLVLQAGLRYEAYWIEILAAAQEVLGQPTARLKA